MFQTATNGINSFNISFVGLCEAILSTCVIISALVIMTQVGGMGIQKQVRATALTLGICALFLKGYATLTTGTLALF